MAAVEDLSGSSYKYTPLPSGTHSLRLLTLLSRSGSREIVCELTTHLWDPEFGIVGSPLVQNELSVVEQAPGSEDEISLYESSWAIESLDQATHGNESIGTSHPSVVYEALSYAWGDGKDLQEIRLNGRLHLVYRNLWDALHFLQREDSTRTLWIDALCIDQSNIAEKSNQVVFMHLVYKHACNVIVWLGVPADNSDLAFTFVKQIWDCVKPGDHVREVEPGVFYGINKLSELVRRLVVSENALAWLSLHQLLSRPWWFRAWTLQESLLAKKATFVCGMKSTSWAVIDLIISVAYETCSEVEHLINSLVGGHLPGSYEWSKDSKFWALSLQTTWHFKRLLDRKSVHPSIAIGILLRTSQYRLCKFPHDKIYSILGLLPPEVHAAMPKPDYGKPFQLIYQQIIQVFVEVTRSLDIICYSQHSDTQDVLLPSWTPDWRRKNRMFTQYDLTYDPSVFRWHFDEIQKSPPAFDASCKILSVHGFNLGVVQRTQLELTLLQINKQFKDLNGSGGHSHSFIEWDFGNAGEALIQESWETLVLDPSWNGYEEAVNTLLGVLHAKLYSNLAQQLPEKSYPASAIQHPIGNASGLQRILEFMTVATRCRSVIETDCLLLCLAPFWVELGDIVCQFIGCTTPTIIRPNGAGGYRFVGDCYVYKKSGIAMVKFLEHLFKSDEKQLQIFDLH